ncbi:Vacuole effluxer Atg22-like protein [Fragilaria crotonensis]|nr:Vacuole effluxer Atg22-like protein [Fragilaria crotonensis]
MTSLFNFPCCYDTAIVSLRSDDDENDTTTKETFAQPPSTIDAVLGWTLDAAARGTVIMGGAVFISTALLKLAREAAGCVEGEECTGRVYGMRPSSLLTNIVTIVGILSAASMPLVGSIIDHTTYRRQVGRASASILTTLILVQVILLKRLWFGAAIIQIFLAFTYFIHLCALYAYLPELTNDSNQLIKYTGCFIASQYASSVVFLLVMVVLLEVFNVADVLTSSWISQSLVFGVCTLFFGYAWTLLFPDRPAAQQVPEGQSILTAGFNKLYATSQTIWSHHDAIKWFLISVAFAESATAAFSSIAITYMTDHLHFSSTENGIAILLLLLFGIPGTRVASMFTNRFNPIRSLQLCLLLWIVTTAAASLVLHGQGQQLSAYCFAAIWGLSTGWVYPTEKVLYCTIIPKGQEAELMGVYICACQILSWLPPLVFTIMNESGISMRIGLLTLNAYFLISFVILFFVGDYQAALEHAQVADLDRNHEQRAEVAEGAPMSDYQSLQH